MGSNHGGVLGGGEDAHPFRAHASIECVITHCPGHMMLNILRGDGTLLQRPYNDGPYYRCNRVGCYYHDHPLGLHEINSSWVRGVNEPRKRTEIREAVK